MPNIAVAELVTVTITGEQVRAEVAEIVDFRTDGGALFADVRLADGTLVEHVPGLDIDVTVRPDHALAVA